MMPVLTGVGRILGGVGASFGNDGVAGGQRFSGRELAQLS